MRQRPVLDPALRANERRYARHAALRTGGESVADPVQAWMKTLTFEEMQTAPMPKLTPDQVVEVLTYIRAVKSGVMQPLFNKKVE